MAQLRQMMLSDNFEWGWLKSRSIGLAKERMETSSGVEEALAAGRGLGNHLCFVIVEARPSMG